MKVCEQLTKKFKGEQICSFLEYYEVVEFKADGTVLLYDFLTDRYTYRQVHDIAMFDIVEQIQVD